MSGAHLIGGGDGTTPLTVDETPGLLLEYVTRRGELVAAEEAGFFAADQWVLGRARLTLERVLDATWLRALHKRALGEVWSWAGRYRTTDKNIGVGARQVSQAVTNLLADAAYWFDAAVTGGDLDHAAGRLHHRLVLVHPFPDGNGRTTRLFTDAALKAVDRPPFTWGSTARATVVSRQAYLDALRHSDRDHRDGVWDGRGLRDLVAYARN